MIELIGQFLFRVAQEIDGVTDAPMLGGRDDLALHQTTGGEFRIAEGLFNRDTVGGL